MYCARHWGCKYEQNVSLKNGDNLEFFFFFSFLSTHQKNKKKEPRKTKLGKISLLKRSYYEV